jgi:hypothetical protein
MGLSRAAPECCIVRLGPPVKAPGALLPLAPGDTAAACRRRRGAAGAPVGAASAAATSTQAAARARAFRGQSWRKRAICAVRERSSATKGQQSGRSPWVNTRSAAACCAFTINDRNMPK